MSCFASAINQKMTMWLWAVRVLSTGYCVAICLIAIIHSSFLPSKFVWGSNQPHKSDIYWSWWWKDDCVIWYKVDLQYFANTNGDANSISPSFWMKRGKKYQIIGMANIFYPTRYTIHIWIFLESKLFFHIFKQNMYFGYHLWQNQCHASFDLGGKFESLCSNCCA